jgi:hypothetical protein
MAASLDLSLSSTSAPSDCFVWLAQAVNKLINNTPKTFFISVSF